MIAFVVSQVAVLAIAMGTEDWPGAAGAGDCFATNAIAGSGKFEAIEMATEEVTGPRLSVHHG